MQGVSINLFIKTGKKKADELGKVFHSDLYGKKDFKYDFLIGNSLNTIHFNELKPEKPFLFFVPKNNKGTEEYEKGIRVNEFFAVNVTGIVTARDNFVIDFEKIELKKRMEIFADLNLSDDSARLKFFGNKKDGKYLSGDSRGWKLVEARKIIQKLNHDDIIKKISYRPFDDRSIYYHHSMVDWGREKYMYNFIDKDNIGIDLCRQLVSENYSHIFITNKIVDDSFVSNKSRERGYVFPLYLYTENGNQQTIKESNKRVPNLNSDILNRIAIDLGLTFTNEKEEPTEGEVCFANSEKVRPEFRITFAPIDILDYIYAVLHSPTYREKYKEFLKIDFPRVPYPKDTTTFWKLVELGGELRQIHLLESRVVEKFITKYPIDGNNTVEKIKYQDKKVFINGTQYFENVPEIAWEFYIGGYQPAQKWLKDRKGRELNFDDILHYQKIIVALAETDRIMKEIDKIKID
jgi:predicted helicase